MQVSDSHSREVAVEPNIVPFIDLMSVLIIFLLITAVWSQVSMIQIGSSIYGKKSDDKVVQAPPRAEVPFRLDVQPSGFQIVFSKQVIKVPKVSGEYNVAALLVELKSVKQKYPDKQDAVITVVDSLPYGSLIKGMDGLLQAGFPQISVATSGVNE
ncbi:MAG: biopolymer transporter ExbD [Bdellovibrionaceae bacterium]|jgi:biopolymer transport protein TolR|nr:biopolymer transporter ExbD [Pseudobdellovibrionaceae bacterium]